MRYQGGKTMIAEPLAKIISMNNGSVDNIFVSLFCGSCVVESKVMGYRKKILNDKHEYLIYLLNGIKNGYIPPEHISKEEYDYIKQHKEENKMLAGFVGFGCSFGGKWFGGYAKGGIDRNYALESKISLLKDMSTLMDAEFICSDYIDVELPSNSVIYADPPYNNTTGYGKVKFNSVEFWKYAREVSEKHIMYISEQNAPEDFISIWEKKVTRTLDSNKDNYFKASEKLYIHESNIRKIKLLNN
ncbi:MAG: DNA adenine methylase [Lachnospiraceae bacterium]|nr:DNA adenine methylase [Lachnospiraceae bacterium]